MFFFKDKFVAENSLKTWTKDTQKAQGQKAKSKKHMFLKTPQAF